ncbi:hypothetical protein [Sphingobium sp. TCM1]|uniref:hypothetical protein n=1 Tax=Sphingobium sp. TCM1 TaxID=453246 RepID=UPI0007F55FFC|nr:hypothetical protein [Sphingobium sp. TCM1]OAN52827.1 hypothetical protein A7Q26_06425 [Sphingobium sp. TCM1]
MILIPISEIVQHQAAEFLEDLADALAGIDRCAACQQAICDHSDLEFAGLVPSDTLHPGAVRSHGGELSKSAAANCFGPVHEDASA